MRLIAILAALSFMCGCSDSFSETSSQQTARRRSMTPKSHVTQDENENFHAHRQPNTPISVHTEPKVCTTPFTEMLDWEANLPPVPSQGFCGDCYAFGTAAYLEALYAKANGKPLLSSLDPTPIAIYNTASVATPKIPYKDVTLTKYSNSEKLNFGGPSKMTFKDASCSTGGDLSSALQALQALQTKTPDKWLCLSQHAVNQLDTVFINSYNVIANRENPNGFIAWSFDPKQCSEKEKKNHSSQCHEYKSFDGMSSYYELSLKPAQELRMCKYVAGIKTDLIPQQTEFSKIGKNIHAPNFQSHIQCMSQSPFVVYMLANDYPSMQTWDFDITGEKMKLSSVDFGTHTICKQQSGACDETNEAVMFGATDHALLITDVESTYLESEHPKFEIDIRNSWGQFWGDNGYLRGKYQGAAACTTNTDCIGQFQSEMDTLNWQKHGWTVGCETISKNNKFCMAKMAANEAPEKCIIDKNVALPVNLPRCPTKALGDAGGRCVAYYVSGTKGNYNPISTDTYCLPSMYDLGVVSMDLATLYWD